MTPLIPQKRRLNRKLKKGESELTTHLWQKNRTAQELFRAEDREVVKLKILEDEQDKRDRLLRFTDHCIFLVKKCRNCKFCRPYCIHGCFNYSYHDLCIF